MTPLQYQVQLLADCDKLIGSFAFTLLTADEQRRAQAARIAIADPDLVVATAMLKAYNRS